MLRAQGNTHHILACTCGDHPVAAAGTVFLRGWFCPLGTILDLLHRILRPVTRRTNRRVGAWAASLRQVRYVALVIVLLFASLSLPIVGYLDPFALLLHTLRFRSILRYTARATR